MRTRFKTLTVRLVLVAAAVAGCSSTTAGSLRGAERRFLGGGVGICGLDWSSPVA